MFTDVEQFITRMKLQELRRQRERLLEAYHQLEEQVAAAKDTATRLRRLYKGIQDLKFAEQPLHPNVANLDVILYQLDSSEIVAEGFLQFWLRQLENELETGRSRADFVYIFGALLVEWAEALPPPASSEQIVARQQILDQLRELKSVPGHQAFLAPLLAPMAKVAEGSRGSNLKRRMDTGYLERNLERIRDNIYRPAPLRQQAGRFLEDPILLNEFSDALTILLDSLEDWRWPAAGVPLMTTRVGGRWRLFLDEDLPTAVLLEVVGDRWMMKYPYLAGEQPPETGGFRGISWTSEGAFQETWSMEEGTSKGIAIREKRGLAHQELRDAIWGVDYTQAGYSGGTELVVRLVNAEAQLWRSAFPGQPRYILKADLKDFYSSISHEVLRTILETGGVLEEDRRIVEEITAVRMQLGDDIIVARRGLANDRLLSHILGETLLVQLEHYVYQQAPVQIIRVVDDICILAAKAAHARTAWQALQTFCGATGLEINERKSGAVCLDSNLPEGFPSRLPAWKFLQLRPDGEWQVDQAALDIHLANAREEVFRASSLMASVEAYNNHLRELLNGLALNVRLGNQHRQSINEAMARFHDHFANGRSIVALLDEMIWSKLSGLDVDMELPEAWFYWPLTAGGLGLVNPWIEVASYAQAHQQERRSKPSTLPEEGWQRKINEWAWFYHYWLEPLQPVAPRETKMMAALVKDFIQRGAQMSGKQQNQLGKYWLWILYTYGPQILERFGSFRFLVTELVPLQLILERRRQVG